MDRDHYATDGDTRRLAAAEHTPFYDTLGSTDFTDIDTSYIQTDEAYELRIVRYRPVVGEGRYNDGNQPV